MSKDDLNLGKYVPLTDYCDKCKKIVTFYKLKKGKAYTCSDCSRHLYYQAGTIFHRSHTPLVKWFIAYALLSEDKNTSAKEIERSIKVTYVTAHRIKKVLINNLEEAGKFLNLYFRDEHFKEEVHEEIAATIYWKLTKPKFEKERRHQLMYLESVRLTDSGMKELGRTRGNRATSAP